MVSTRGRGREKQTEKKKEEEAGNGGGGDAANRTTEYEESRAQRIKENTERMKSLGIFDLSKNLKRPSSKPPSSSARKSKTTFTSSNDPPRRSSRLKDVPPVSYTEKKAPKKDKSVKNVEIHIPEGEKPEIYTEEHEKLLGDSKAVWTLWVDGYDEDGQRIYDPVEGKSCHQCRQKTLGHHTECSKCEMVTGQFCGDCLYMRYGENVLEVNENPDWICPVCRGICNCSRCRRDKGWQPTGAIYKKVASLGFKSVAHYLIYTRRGQAIMPAAATEDPIPAGGSHSADDKVQEPSDTLSLPVLVGKNNEMEEDDGKTDNDEESRGDDDEEDGDNVDIESASQ
ncbi:Cell division cycle-associated 7-like protein [Sesamum alatum]|uniref:Cell division cycle-associated 7-like protein n=1 Tax=Sesamum alatum TaxID=300844 RepID=A0AAE1XT37_9LAMI|nr:Cell division cycle-associated 7-like protein [Sesamum alatum]